MRVLLPLKKDEAVQLEEHSETPSSDLTHSKVTKTGHNSAASEVVATPVKSEYKAAVDTVLDTTQEACKLVQSTGAAESKEKEAKVETRDSKSIQQTTSVAGVSSQVVLVAASSVARLPSPSRSASPSGLLASSPSISTTTTSNVVRSRKRRALSPNSLSLESNSASKKLRDCKPPARENYNNKAKATSPETGLGTGSSIDTGNMTGGGNSRGGRKHWAGTGSSYYVDSNAGRDDVSNNSDSSAEVDVRFAYRHENDPASARGDTPLLSIGSHVAVRSPVAGRNYHAQCGRDDDVVDLREGEARLRDRSESDEDKFVQALKKRGLEIVEQEGDGNCLFRAISLQVYGDASMHEEVRQRCIDFMSRDKEHFSQFITDEPFEQYIQRKRQDGVHGNNPEIQAISELFNRPIEVFVPENGASPLNIFHAEYKTQDAPIRLSYHDGNHYNAVIDPLVPTAGLGLGLPGLQPGLADKMQMAKAVAESDRLADQREFEKALEESQNDQLQRAIKESSLSMDHMFQNKALSLSDCDATNFELEQAVLESSLESFRNQEHGRKQASSSSGKAVSRRKLPQNDFPSSSAASVASLPTETRQDSSSSPVVPVAAAAAAVSVASAPPAAASRPPSNSDEQADMPAGPLIAENYPQSVQELVMNGFELRKVVHAYELVGDNFDDLLGFLMSTSTS